jgi:signal peptidase I
MSVVSDKSRQESGGVGELIRVVIHAFILALIVRTLFFQPFNIPSGSMQDTLQIGDFVFVSKWSYGYSRYSIPFSPNVLGGERVMGFWGHTPQRGDIAVFKFPMDTRACGTAFACDATDYIKRVIGLPGDTVQVKDGILYINGTAVPRQKMPDRVVNLGAFPQRVSVYKETLPNGVSYETLDQGHSRYDDTELFTVPAGHYFMMGDNRDNSLDSRAHPVPGENGVGFVPLENFVGKAQLIFFSVEDAPAWQFWRWPWTVRFERLFSVP